MKKAILTIVPALAIICSVAAGQKKEWRSISPRQKLQAIESTINNYYVDTINEEMLVEAAIRGMTEQLDPHSIYSDKEETTDLTEPLDGNFSGVGIEFNMQNDTLYVVQTVAGGPSERVGIQPGDRFIAVNDTVIAGKGMKNTDIMKRLRGKKGTEVCITVVRRGVAEPIEFRVTRDDIPLYSIDAAYMIDDKTGYIRLSRFARTSLDEFLEAEKKLKKQGMKQLILDLTDNGGGYLDIAATIANQFLEKGELIVYTQGRKQPRRDMEARGDGKMKEGRLVVMVNQFSASASEILSGALQDWDRAVIVGRRTFGKGLVQHPIVFPDGTMLRLSIARYYTPSGRSIQKPYEQGKQKEYELDILNRYNHGELESADSVKFDESLKFTTLKTRRTVYGGGGIMPDVFVPVDTTGYSDFYRDIVAKGTLNNFVIRYVDNHRKELESAYKDDMQFVREFAVSDSMMTELIADAKKACVKYDETQYRKSEPLMRSIIKALIARDIFDRSAYFRIANENEPIYREAVRTINSPEYPAILNLSNEN